MSIIIIDEGRTRIPTLIKPHRTDPSYVERKTYLPPYQTYRVMSHDLVFAPQNNGDFRVIVHCPFFARFEEVPIERAQHFYIGLLVRFGDFGFLYSFQEDDSTRPLGSYYPYSYPLAGKDHLGYVDGRLIMKVEFASIIKGIERFVELVEAKVLEQKKYK